MKNVFSRYYKIILSSIILVALLVLRENYVAFDEMTGIRSVIRMLLYTAWGGVLSTKIRRNRVEGVCLLCYFRLCCVEPINSHLGISKKSFSHYHSNSRIR